MDIDCSFWITFVLFASWIGLAGWIAAQEPSKKKYLPWILLAILALTSGMIAGYVAIIAIPVCVIFVLVTRAFVNSPQASLQKAICGVVVALFCLTFALHVFPGFQNPILIINHQFSADAVPYTQYANFDKAVVGAVLLGYVCQCSTTLPGLWKRLRRAVLITLISAAIILLIATTLNFTHLVIKFPTFTPIFLIVNLLFTVVAEEAFFRGFLQSQCVLLFVKNRFAPLIAIIISAVLFGLAHIAGGLTYFFLSCLLGLACAYSFYVCEQKIEAPILVHFLFNAIHFMGFSYPRSL